METDLLQWHTYEVLTVLLLLQVVGRIAAQIARILQVSSFQPSGQVRATNRRRRCKPLLSFKYWFAPYADTQGKDKPTYTPNLEEGDVVVVTNARHVEFTGRKWDQKLYRWHTG